MLRPRRAAAVNAFPAFPPPDICDDMTKKTRGSMRHLFGRRSSDALDQLSANLQLLGSDLVVGPRVRVHRGEVVQRHQPAPKLHPAIQERNYPRSHVRTTDRSRSPSVRGLRASGGRVKAVEQAERRTHHDAVVVRGEDDGVVPTTRPGIPGLPGAGEEAAAQRWGRGTESERGRQRRAWAGYEERHGGARPAGDGDSGSRSLSGKFACNAAACWWEWPSGP